jgi:uncharacterized protein YciI
MNLYCYRLSLRPEHHNLDQWGPWVQEAMKAHSDHLQRAIKNGTALMVGRSDAAPAENFGLVIFQATDDKAAAAFAESDPAVIHQVMTATTQPFKLYHLARAAEKFQLW